MKRKAVKKVSESPVNLETMGEALAKAAKLPGGFPELCRGTKDAIFAIDRYTRKDVGGCLQCIEFAIQQLECAKAKLMKTYSPYEGTTAHGQ